MPRTRNAALAAAVVVVVLVVAALALPRLVDVNAYRPQLQAALASRLHRQVSLGQIQLSLVPFGLRVRDAAIADDPAFQTSRLFARAEELYVRLGPIALLRGHLDIHSLELRRPAIELIRDSRGRWNVASLGGGTGEHAPRLELRHFAMTGGEVAVTDLRNERATTSAPLKGAPYDLTRDAAARTLYRNIDMQLEDYSPGKPFDVTLAATLPGDGTQRLTLTGTGGPLVLEPLAMTPFDGNVQFDEVSLAGVQRFLTLKGLAGTNAVISGGADLTNRDERLVSKGELRFDHVRTHGHDVGYPIAAAFDITHDSRTSLLTITSGKFRLDQTPLSVNGTVKLKPGIADVTGSAPRTPVLDLRVIASDVSIAEAARLAAAFDLAFANDTRVEGRLTADATLRGPVSRPALDGRLQLRQVSVSGAHIPQPVHTPAVDLSLSPQEIRTNDFSASTNGTSLGMRVAVRNYTTARPLLDVAVRTADADLGDMLSIAHAWGIRAADGIIGRGKVTLALRAAGPRDALTYGGTGTLRDATLQTPSIAQPLRVAHADLTFDSDAATIQRLAASIGKTNAQGSVTVRHFTAPMVEFQLAADRIDVADMQEALAPTRTLQQRSGHGESMLLRTTGSGRVRIGSLTYDHLVLDDVQADATADRGLIRLQPLTAALFGGRHRGSIVIDARRRPTTFAINSNLQQVDANQLLTAIVNRRDAVFGALTSVVRMNLSSNGLDNMARSLNGTLSLNLPDARIPSIDLLNEVGTIARFVTASEDTDRSTRVTAVSGTFAVTNGVAHTDDLTASIGHGSLGATGAINLVDQRLNLRVTTVLSQGFSRLVGGTRVGGFMTTTLANSNGELVVPILITGTMQQPRVAPDVQRMAEMKLRNLAPGLRDPQRLTTAILRGVIDQQAGNRTQRRTVDDIIGAVTGRTRAGSSQRQDESPDQPATPPEQPTTSKPERKDPAQEIRDALEDLLGRRKSRDP